MGTILKVSPKIHLHLFFSSHPIMISISLFALMIFSVLSQTVCHLSIYLSLSISPIQYSRRERLHLRCSSNSSSSHFRKIANSLLFLLGSFIRSFVYFSYSVIEMSQYNEDKSQRHHHHNQYHHYLRHCHHRRHNHFYRAIHGGLCHVNKRRRHFHASVKLIRITNTNSTLGNVLVNTEWRTRHSHSHRHIFLFVLSLQNGSEQNKTEKEKKRAEQSRKNEWKWR